MKGESRVWMVLAWLMVFLAGSLGASAAMLEGTVYDYTLSKVDHAVVEVGTYPVQRQVTADGRYRFEVEPGNYSLSARAFRKQAVTANASYMISVKTEGRFTVDLILDPVLEFGDEEEGSEEDAGIAEVLWSDEQGDLTARQGLPVRVWLAVGMVVLLMGGWLWKARGGKHPDVIPAQLQGKPQGTPVSSLQRSDLLAVLRVLGGHEGRATQREIRMALPFSEAKVSLMLVELEHEGLVKKIKKGRGNIIILNEGQREVPKIL